MEIAGISVATPAPDLKTSVGVALLSKSLDTIEQAGDGMIKMMEQSVQPHLGQNIDLTI